MVICPVARAVGCAKCPVFGICPVKGLIGDYNADARPGDKPAASAAAATRSGTAARARAKPAAKAKPATKPKPAAKAGRAKRR